MHTLAIEIGILVHSASLFMHEAIESACAQTTLQWECMIVVDGATDEAPNRLAAYRDARIRWSRQDNIGDLAALCEGSH